MPQCQTTVGNLKGLKRDEKRIGHCLAVFNQKTGTFSLTARSSKTGDLGYTGFFFFFFFLTMAGKLGK